MSENPDAIFPTVDALEPFWLNAADPLSGVTRRVLVKLQLNTPKITWNPPTSSTGVFYDTHSGTGVMTASFTVLRTENEEIKTKAKD